jgi:SNF2 family DNA or RNA helicase
MFHLAVGSLSSFRHLIADPLDRYNRARSLTPPPSNHSALVDAAQQAKEKLNQILQRVMIRRSRDEVLRALLPPRREYLLKCNLTVNQGNAYAEVANVMKK